MPLSMTRRRVTFQVVGVAQPKGSARAFIPKGWTRPVVTSDNPEAKGWQQLVAERAHTVAGDGQFVGPIELTVTFYLPRPKGIPKHTLHHLKKPDLDKLLRSTKDALSRVLYRDDSQVVVVHARKVYAPGATAPGACITLEEADVPAPLQGDFFDWTLFDERR